MEKVRTSYIGIMVPPDLCDKFQAIRTKHMKNMASGPHVTLVDPFVHHRHFETVAPMIREKLKHIEPFTISFRRFSYFKQRKRRVLYLEPIVSGKELITVQKAIVEITPNCDDLVKNYVPHLTMGFCEGDLAQAQSVLDQLRNEWEPVEFQVKEICILSKCGTEREYHVRQVIQLGEHESKPLHNVVPIVEDQ